MNIIKEIFIETLSSYGSELVEFESDEDHIYILVRIDPKVRVSGLVRSLKTASSSTILRYHFKSVKNKLWRQTIWSPSYFVASCGGAPLEIIKSYIQNQDRPRT